MDNELLKVAQMWKHKFAQANDAIESTDLERALNLLLEAEQLAETLGAEDERLARTLDRMAFINHKQGLTDKAEALYRKALAIADRRILAGLLRLQIRAELARLLKETGRVHEAQKFIDVETPSYTESEKEKLERKSPPLKLMHSLMLVGSTCGDFDQSSILTLLEEILTFVENTHDAQSLEVVVALQLIADFIHRVTVGTAVDLDDMTQGMAKSCPYLRRAFLISNKLYGPDSGELVDVMRLLARCETDRELGRALQIKADAIEAHSGIANLEHQLARKVTQKLGLSPPPDTLSLVEAEEILNRFCISAPADTQPFISLSLSKKQQYEQLLSATHKSIALAERIESNSPHPLTTVVLLADLSEIHQDFGDAAAAKSVKEREFKLIVEKWGAGHIMAVQAMEELSQL